MRLCSYTSDIMARDTPEALYGVLMLQLCEKEHGL